MSDVVYPKTSWPYNSDYKQCTYYLFHHHGDAFMTFNSEVPTNLSVLHASSIDAGDSTFAISATGGSLVGLTVDDELVGSVIANGTVQTVNITPLAAGDTLKVVVTKVNHYRYTAYVPCSESIIPVPSQVQDLVISRVGNSAGLNWSPVTQDTTGTPIAITYYIVYKSADDPTFTPTPSDSIGTVYPPNRNYLDTDAFDNNNAFYNVKAFLIP